MCNRVMVFVSFIFILIFLKTSQGNVEKSAKLSSSLEECFPPVTSTNPICYPLTSTPEPTTIASTSTTVTTERTTIVTTDPTTATEITERTTTLTTDEPKTTTELTERTSIVTTDPTTTTKFHRIKCLNYYDLVSSSSNQMPLLPRIIANVSEDIVILRPFSIRFDIHNINQNEVKINFYFYLGEQEINTYLLIYYPEDFDASDSSMTEEQVKDEMRCSFVNNHTMQITDLDPSTSYKFCTLYGESMISPFSCQLHQIVTPVVRQTWINQEYKVITLTLVVIIILFALIIGILMTYLIMRIIMSGSKHDDSSHKDPPMSASTEASHTLTPLPTHNVDQRPPLERSSSDMSLRSAQIKSTVNPH